MEPGAQSGAGSRESTTSAPPASISVEAGGGRVTGAARDYGPWAPIPDLFERAAARTPGATALVFGDDELSYAELNARANRLARHLRSRGVDRESLVGVHLERSVEMVVALLAVLKAGGAYLPLDPEHPADRLRLVLDEAAPAVVLSARDLAGGLPGAYGPVTLLDEDAAAWEGLSGDDLGVRLEPANAIYVLYTSGSTGRPKGVVNTHGGLANRLLWMQEEYALDHTDVVLQKTPYGFDVSAWEFFWPLIVGARLAVARPGEHRDPDLLAATITRHGVTALHFVPSMLQTFLVTAEEAGLSGPVTSVRQVFCSGEALPVSVQRSFPAVFSARLHNLYGPTEAAIDVTYWPCDPSSGRDTVPIGYPIANTGVYVLDRDLRPVPAGGVGEIHLAGAGLARGYLSRHGATADRFVPDPFAGPGERMYRTGDLGRVRDGAVEYCGRTDDQVKVRGFRIELGDVQAAMAAHPDVAAAAVTVLEHPATGRYLAGYYVGRRDESLPASRLREALLKRLPEYMVPTTLTPLDALPVTANGKLDRGALPVPGRTPPRAGAPAAPAAPHIPPRTPTERAVAVVWADLLGHAPVGAGDNFLELGGHSMAAARIAARIRTELRADLQVRDFYDHPVLERLAARVDELRAGGQAGPPPIRRISRVPAARTPHEG